MSVSEPSVVYEVNEGPGVRFNLGARIAVIFSRQIEEHKAAVIAGRVTVLSRARP